MNIKIFSNGVAVRLRAHGKSGFLMIILRRFFILIKFRFETLLKFDFMIENYFHLFQLLSIISYYQELAMDILRVLSAPDLEVRKKTLNLALDLVSSRNVEEVFFIFER